MGRPTATGLKIQVWTTKYTEKKGNYEGSWMDHIMSKLRYNKMNICGSMTAT